MRNFAIIFGFILATACSKQTTTTTEVAGGPVPPPASSETVATTTPTQTSTEMETPMSDVQNMVAELNTSKGTITIRFFPDKAPNHVKNFIELSKQGYYNGTRFHRIVPGFMIQGGDPNTRNPEPSTWGMGGSGKNLKAEFNDVHHARGVVSMARSGHPDSASSQFFICVADAGFLDKQYTAFGEVTSGMDVVDAIVSAPKRGEAPVTPETINSVTVREASASEKK